MAPESLPWPRTSAPNRRMAATFTGDAVSGTNTMPRPPSTESARATPSPWLPEEAVTTPRSRCSAVSVRTLASAPRALNEPVRCRCSHLTSASAPSSSATPWKVASGVSVRCSRILGAISSDCAATAAGDAGTPSTVSVRPPSCRPAPTCRRGGRRPGLAAAAGVCEIAQEAGRSWRTGRTRGRSMVAGALPGTAQIFTAGTVHPLTGPQAGTPPAFATLGEWIVATGAVARLREMFPGAPVHDFGRRVLVPGFNDAHQHPSMMAGQLLDVDLSPERVGSRDQLLDLLRERAEATPAGEWVQGSRYDHTKTTGGVVLTRAELDGACP